MENNDYSTRSVWLAAGLAVILKIKPVLTNESGLVTFAFPMSDNTLTAVGKFYNGECLSIFGYSEMVKNLRHQMYECKSDGGPRRSNDNGSN